MSLASRFDEVLAGFRAGIEAGRLAQAYLIVGAPRGEGLALALRIQELLYCQGERRPCGACKGCRDVAARAHPDVCWIEPIKKSQGILVEQVEQVQRHMYQTSYTGGYKVCVLIAADRMNNDAANKFLKVLEEPPGQSLFLLISDSPHAILPTILSRCQRVTVAAEQGGLPAEMWQGIRELLVAPELEFLGHVWRAKRLVAILKAMRKAVEGEVTAQKREGDSEEALEARINARYRELRTLVMRGILLWHRDILLLVTGADESWLHYRDSDSVAALRARAARTDCRAALRDVGQVEWMQEQLEKNLAENSVFTLGFGRLTGAAGGRTRPA